jgi:FAD/FMN-containing dehydrogenase
MNGRFKTELKILRKTCYNRYFDIKTKGKYPFSTELAVATELNARLVRRAMAVGGTCSGEHGVGIGKIDYLADEHGAALDVMKAIKRTLDPDNLMNPGKMFAI